MPRRNHPKPRKSKHPRPAPSQEDRERLERDRAQQGERRPAMESADPALVDAHTLAEWPRVSKGE